MDQPAGGLRGNPKSLRDGIGDDLGWAAQRLLKKCYCQAEGEDERKHPRLARVAKPSLARKAGNTVRRSCSRTSA